MIATDDLRYHTEVGTGFTKDTMLAMAADELDELRKSLHIRTAQLSALTLELRRRGLDDVLRLAMDAGKRAADTFGEDMK